MYKLNLTEAYCPAQADTPMRERTIEELEAVFNFNMTDEEAVFPHLRLGSPRRKLCFSDDVLQVEKGTRAERQTFSSTKHRP